VVQIGGAVGNPNAQAPAITPVAPNIDLFQLELVVSWGTYYLTHNARFVTLRAVTPDNGQQNGQQNGQVQPPMPRAKR
jgi:hypothetical protein